MDTLNEAERQLEQMNMELEAREPLEKPVEFEAANGSWPDDMAMYAQQMAELDAAEDGFPDFGPADDGADPVGDVESSSAGEESNLDSADLPDPELHGEGDLPEEHEPSDFLGHENARSLLLSGGAAALVPAVSTLAEHSRVGEAVSEAHTKEQGYTSRKNQHAVPMADLSQHEGFDPNRLTGGQLMGLAFYKLANLFGKATSGIAKMPAKVGVEACLSYSKERHFNDFSKSMAAAEQVAIDWSSAVPADASIEEKIAYLKSESGMALEERMEKITRDIEASAIRAAEAAMRTSEDAEPVLKRTAEEVARYADRNKQMLEMMSDGQSSLLQRLDTLTNNIFQTVKAFVMKLFGLHQQNTTQPRIG